MKRKGFTLVELLIVIVVIGILSAMMMLSSTEAVTSARASNIVSNLRNLKTAALSLYTDNLDSADNDGLVAGKVTVSNGIATVTGSMGQVIKYMNNDDKTAYANYGITKTTEGWFVYCDSISDGRVQSKLAGRAKSVGILGATAATGLAQGSSNIFKEGNTVAGMWVVKPAVTTAPSN